VQGEFGSPSSWWQNKGAVLYAKISYSSAF